MEPATSPPLRLSPFARLFGWAEIAPSGPAVAGTHGTWVIRYHTGSLGVDDWGRIRVAFRIDGDWGVAQTSEPGAPNYVTVSTTASARVTASYDHRGHIRPWSKALTVLVEDGYLEEDDEVSIVLGDTTHGSPGFEVQPFIEPRSRFNVYLDLAGTGRYMELEPLQTIAVVSGPAASLLLVLPTDQVATETFDLGLIARDEWGNVATDYRGLVALSAEPALIGLPAQLTAGSNGVTMVRGVSAPEPATYRVTAMDRERRLVAVSNPLVVRAEPPARRRYWGDLHGQSGETCGTGTAHEYFEFARDKALVHFAGTQGNDFELDRVGWETIKDAVHRYNEPGRFAAFLGYEWSGNTGAGGDHNVYFTGDDGPLLRSGHWLVDDLSDQSNDCLTVSQLYEALRSRGDAFLVPHVGGRFANLAFHEPRLEPLVEIYSTHGEFEWMLADALARGYHVGVSCSSDDHTGRPGLTAPARRMFAVKGGLLCVLSEELTREGIARAIRERRCYGTTGERIALDVRVGGVGMGEETAVHGAPGFDVTVAGTTDIERIELRRGMTCVSAVPNKADAARDPKRVRITWSGARNRGRNRAADWDGVARVSGTRVVSTRPYAFDRRSEGIVRASETEVEWRSTTCGDADGVILELEPADRGTLSIETNQGALTVELASLDEGPVSRDLGGVGLRIVVERLPTGLGTDLAVRLSDSDIAEGTHAYHVMVLQTDGAKAWSSPIWVNRAAN